MRKLTLTKSGLVPRNDAAEGYAVAHEWDGAKGPGGTLEAALARLRPECDPGSLAYVIECLITLIAADPGQVTVSETVGRTVTLIEVHVSEADRGQVLGRDGDTIRMIRRVAAVLGARIGRRYEIRVDDSNAPGHPSEPR